MAVTLTSAEQALKNFYLDVVAEHLNYKINPFMSVIRRTSGDVWGKEVRKLAVIGINGGFKAGSETDDLPVSAVANYVNFVLPLKNLYGTIEISDKAIRASENNTGAFVNLLNAEMEGLIKACSLNFGRMLFGDGSGKLATVTRVGKDGSTIYVSDVKNLIEGMIVDFLTPSGELFLAKQKRIISVDKEKKTIKVDQQNNVYNSDIFKNAIITIQGSYNKELTGLEAIFKKDGELYGLDRAEHKWLNPYIKEKQGEITEEAIQAAIDHIEEVSGGGVNYIVCSYGVKRAIRNMMRKNTTDTDLSMASVGNGALSVCGIPVVADRFCPDGTMYLLNSNDFELHQLCDWVWLEQGDGTILRQVPNKPVYTATLVKYADLLCSKPFGQGKICGIKEE